ncbi:hypothetical protein KBK19_01135 [Microvirga sp. STR05]|uniref:DUF6311 domain-containing protein n=1 Tax=Hymenobacter duratus TaxID=2771356 RepID=A0ABR8JD20_9BACT|nr:hypothetical protein [Hymenobacter duratus]MBD2713630.1 hypothetical protein [Hymenobacter duratus]MBR7948532.1 hypothetical protein [Microvirga sp. STR05]
MKNWLRLTLLLAFYALLFVVFTWPLAANFTSSFLAVPGRDSYQFFWNVWHFRDAVLSGHNPYVTDWVFYPHGSGLVMHAYTPLMGLVSVLLGNEMLAVNTGLLLSYALSGTGAYLLARRWIKSPILSLLAGFVFAYSPYKLQRLPEHYNLVLTATVPFYILLFLRAFEFREGRFLPIVRSWGAVAGCFALGIVTLLSDYYVLFGLLYFSLAYAAWFWFRIGRIRWRERRTWFWLVGILVGSHLIIRLLRLKHVSENGGIWWGGDVVSYLMPPPTSRFVYWDWAERLYNNAEVFNMPGNLENTVFIGYVLPLLAVVLWVLRLAQKRPVSQRFQDVQGRPLLWVLIIFLLFTVPALRIYGHERLNLPTAILHFIPFFNNIRCPTRWIMMVGLLLPLVSFSALEAAWHGRLRPATQILLSLALAVLIGLEFWPQPYQRASRAAIPAVFKEVAKLPGTTLVPIPLGILDGYRQVGVMQSEQMFYQTLHRKKLPIGYLSRVRPELFASLDQEPVLHALLHQQMKPDTIQPAPPTTAQLQSFLRTYDPAAFVIDPAYRNKPVHLYLRQLLLPFGYRERLVGGYVLLAKP